MLWVPGHSKVECDEKAEDLVRWTPVCATFRLMDSSDNP